MNKKTHRLVAALLLISFALICLIFFRPSLLTLAKFRVFPDDQLNTIRIIIALWHMGWGVALLFDFIPRAVSWASLAALLVYAGLVAVALSKGVDVSCGCIKNHLVLTGYIGPTLIVMAVEIMPLIYGRLTWLSHEP